jgi:hypothetical protein
MATIKELEELSIGQSLELCEYETAVRVPYGWIIKSYNKSWKYGEYNYSLATTCFVPDGTVPETIAIRTEGDITVEELRKAIDEFPAFMKENFEIEIGDSLTEYLQIYFEKPERNPTVR